MTPYQTAAGAKGRAARSRPNGFHHLGSFQLTLTHPSDEALSHLRGMTGLEVLHADNSRRVSDRGVQALRELINLKELSLNRTNVGDNGLAALQGLGKLESLDLGGTKISDHGLFFVRGLVKLKRINLEGTSFSDRGLVWLKRLKALEHLERGRT